MYLIDDSAELMRLAASYNWPAQYEGWLGEVRVRLGAGPSEQGSDGRRFGTSADPADRTVRECDLESRLG